MDWAKSRHFKEMSSLILFTLYMCEGYVKKIWCLSSHEHYCYVHYVGLDYMVVHSSQSVVYL